MVQGTGNKELGFRQLLAWQKADDLAAEVFRISKLVRPADRWLADQMWHAAFSVTSNIAEGYGRSSLNDYLRFLEMAGGSLNEVENALHVLRRNQIVPTEELEAAKAQREAAGNLLFGLMRSLRAKAAAKGEWHRGIRETSPAYGLPVPSSEFPVREE